MGGMIGRKLNVEMFWLTIAAELTITIISMIGCNTVK